MGWLFSHREPKREPLKEWIIDKVNCEDESRSWKVLDCAIVNFSTAYMAAEYVNKKDGSRRVIALVLLIRHHRGEYCNWGYKDMDETMGPCENQCPKRILELLTPLTEEDGYAKQWRLDCWKNIALSEKLKPGVKINTKEKVSFGSYGECSHFELISVKPFHLKALDLGGMRVRISKRYLLDILEEVV